MPVPAPSPVTWPVRAPAPAQAGPSYGVVLPLKRLALAKTRLQDVPDAVRADLVTAFLADTLAAVSSCPAVGGVLVVTDEVPLAHALRVEGVAAVPDGVSGDLNATLVQGAAELLRTRPGLRPVALCADLPCLRAADLTRALRSAPGETPAFVPDAAGEATTLYTAPTLDRFSPRFGHRSRTAHLAAGASELAAAPTLRRDVDTPADLAAARALGLGPRTALALTLSAAERLAGGAGGAGAAGGAGGDSS